MNSPIDIHSLTGVAKAFAELAQTRWPQFMAYAKEEEGSLRFDIPAPSGACSLMIIADIDFDETIIGIGGGHSHGGPWKEPDDADYRLEGTVRFIDDIMCDRAVGCCHLNGGGSIGRLDLLQAAEWWPQVTQIHSWSGVHDEQRHPRMAS